MRLDQHWSSHVEIKDNINRGITIQKEHTQFNTCSLVHKKQLYVLMNTPHSILFVVPTLTFKAKSIIDKLHLGQQYYWRIAANGQHYYVIWDSFLGIFL